MPALTHRPGGDEARGAPAIKAKSKAQRGLGQGMGAPRCHDRVLPCVTRPLKPGILAFAAIRSGCPSPTPSEPESVHRLRGRAVLIGPAGRRASPLHGRQSPLRDRAQCGRASGPGVLGPLGPRGSAYRPARMHPTCSETVCPRSDTAAAGAALLRSGGWVCWGQLGAPSPLRPGPVTGRDRTMATRAPGLGEAAARQRAGHHATPRRRHGSPRVPLPPCDAGQASALALPTLPSLATEVSPWWGGVQSALAVACTSRDRRRPHAGSVPLPA
jgi:hypothetical protein